MLLKCFYPTSSMNTGGKKKKNLNAKINFLMEEKSICPNPTRSHNPVVCGRTLMDLLAVQSAWIAKILGTPALWPGWQPLVPLEPRCLKAGLKCSWNTVQPSVQPRSNCSSKCLQKAALMSLFTSAQWVIREHFTPSCGPDVLGTKRITSVLFSF